MDREGEKSLVAEICVGVALILGKPVFYTKQDLYDWISLPE